MMVKDDMWLERHQVGRSRAAVTDLDVHRIEQPQQLFAILCL